MLELNKYYVQEIEKLTDLFTTIFVIVDDIKCFWKTDFINLAQLYDYLNNHIAAFFILIDISIKIADYLHPYIKNYSIIVIYWKKMLKILLKNNEIIVFMLLL